MVRRSRAPPSASRRNLPARTPVAPTKPAVAQPQQPSMFGQMASTAAGVAVGSAIGHTAGAAITGMFSGGSAPAETMPQQQQQPQSIDNQTQYPCAWEIQQFLKCADTQADITLCQGFNEALRQCKSRYNVI